MAYADIFNAANDPLFQGRCLVAMWRAAQDIAAEAPEAPSHQQRADWATRVLQDKAIITPRQLAMQVLRNMTIAANPGGSSDDDIQFQVNSILLPLIAIG
jgi:cytochrome c5